MLMFMLLASFLIALAVMVPMTRKALLGGGALMVAGAAMAQTTGTDYSSLVSAVDWSDVVTNIITVFAAGVTLILAWMGGRFILRAIKGSH